MTLHLTHKHNSEDGPSRRLARWPVRAAVWLALIVVLGAGYLSLPGSASSPAGTVGVDTVQVTGTSSAGGTGVLAAEGDGIVPDACGSVPDSIGNVPDCSQETDSTPSDVLPAYRWGGNLSGLQKLGVGDVAESTSVGLAGLAFAFSSFLWMVNLTLIRAVDNTDILSMFAGTVNATFVNVAGAIWGIVALGYLMILVRLARQILNGDVAGFLRVLAGFVIPMAFILSMANAANNPVAKDNANLEMGADTGWGLRRTDAGGVTVPGTPAWAANKVIENIDQAGVGIATVFDPLQPDMTQLGIGEQPEGYDCQPYIDALEKTYVARSAGNASGGPMLFASKMWTLVVFDPWSIATLGDQEYRHKASCHAAEWFSGTSPAEQQRIAKAAYGHDFSETVFTDTDRKFGNNDWSEAEWHFGMWQACTSDATMNKQWRDALTEVDEKFSDSATANEICATWADASKGMDEASGIDTAVEKVYKKRGALESGPAKDYVTAVTGHNATNRVVMGLASAIGSIVYLWAFAGASVGVLMAKIGLILALMVLPVTLTMIGLGMESGTKLLRWTAALCAVDLVFTVLLGLLFQITLVGVQAIGGWGVFSAGGGVQAGFGKIVLIAAIPLAAVMGMNKILKSLGLGKITTPWGAAGLVGRTSSKAFNAPSTKDYLKNEAAGKVAEAKRAQGNAKRGFQAAQRVRDPFGTGVNRLKKNAADAARLHGEGKMGASGAKKKVDAYQSAQAEHDRKKDSLKRSLTHPLKTARSLYGLNATEQGTLDGFMASVVSEKKDDTKGKGDGDDKAGLGAGEDFRSRADGYTGAQLVDDATARADRARALGQETEIAVEGIGDPRSRSAIGGHAVHGVLAATGAASLGELDGLDLSDITSRQLDEGLRGQIAAEVAADLHVRPENVMVDHYGNALIDPTTFDSMGEVPVHLRARPEFHLDSQMLDTRELETAADRATRISGTLVSMGYLGLEGGQTVIQHRWDLPSGPETMAGQSAWAKLDSPDMSAAIADAIGRIVIPTEGIAGALADAAAAASRIDSAIIADALRAELGSFRNTQDQAVANLSAAASELAGAVGRIDVNPTAALPPVASAAQQLQVVLDSGALGPAVAGIAGAVASSVATEIGRARGGDTSGLEARLDQLGSRLEAAIANNPDQSTAALNSVANELRNGIDALAQSNAQVAADLQAQMDTVRYVIGDLVQVHSSERLVGAAAEDRDTVGEVVGAEMAKQAAILNSVADKIGSDNDTVIEFFQRFIDEVTSSVDQASSVSEEITRGAERLLAGWSRYSTPSRSTINGDDRGAFL